MTTVQQELETFLDDTFDVFDRVRDTYTPGLIDQVAGSQCQRPFCVESWSVMGRSCFSNA